LQDREVGADVTLDVEQELYLGDERARKGEAADAERRTAETWVGGARREAAVRVLEAVAELRLARTTLALATESLRLAEDLAKLVALRAQKGLAPGVDSDQADAATLLVRRGVVEAEARVRSSLVALNVAATGRPDAGLDAQDEQIEGLLAPERIAKEAIGPAAAHFDKRPEIRAARAESEASKQRVRVIEAARTPTLTVGVWLGRTEFTANALGVRVGLPLNLWRDGQAEVVEANAMSRAAYSRVASVERRAAVEIAASRTAWESAVTARKALQGDVASRLAASVARLHDAVSKGLVPARDALLAQRSLQELREALLTARSREASTALCLLLAVGAPIPGEEVTP